MVGGDNIMAMQGKWALSGGSYLDETANNNDLSNNSGTGAPTQVNGHQGDANGALRFTESNSQGLRILSGSQTGLNISAAMTIAFKIYIPTALPSSGLKYTIVSRANDGNVSTDGYQVHVIDSGSVRFKAFIDGSSKDRGGPVVLSVGQWHSCVCRFDGSDMWWDIDGNTGNKLAAVGTINTVARDFYIGKNISAGGWYLDGRVDDVIITNASQSDAWVTDYHNLGADFSSSSSSSLSSSSSSSLSLSSSSSSSQSSSLSSSTSSSSSLSSTSSSSVSQSSSSSSSTSQSSSSSSSSNSSSSSSSTSSSSSSTGAAGTVSGTVRDRQGSVINCSTYNVRLNVYPKDNISSTPLASQLITASDGTWSQGSLAIGTKYLVTHEFEGLYGVLNDTDIAGAALITAV
jgi:hypothetical protein